MRQLKQLLDPAHRFNKGRVYPELSGRVVVDWRLVVVWLFG